MDRSERFYHIDLLRFLAAISVVLYHYTFRGFAADDLSLIEFPHLAEVFQYGYLGVDLFFMISGFVILLSVQGKTLANFVLARMLRLYPAFWVCVTLTSLFILIFADDRFAFTTTQYLVNLSMLSGVFYVPYIDGVYWTLLVEIKFYFLVALLLLFRLMRGLVYALSAWLLYAWLAPSQGFAEKLNFFLIPEWAAYFISGALFYLIYKEGPSLAKVLALIGAYGLAISNANHSLHQLNSIYAATLNPYCVSLIISVFYLVMAMIAFRKGAQINQQSFLYLGALTYPLYLIHQNLGYMVFNYFADQTNRYVLLMATIALVLGLSYLIHLWVEKKFTRWFRQHFILGMRK